MRSFANTLLMESAMDSISTNNFKLWELADTVTAPMITLTEEDCGTLLGEQVRVDYDAEGLVELSLGEALSRDRINALKASGVSKVDVRSLRACIAPNGLCRACVGASKPLLTTVPPVGSKIKIPPEIFLQIVQYNLLPGFTDIPLDFSPEQYDFLYLYNDGDLVPASNYTITGKTLALSAIPGSVPPTLLMHFDGDFVDATGNTVFTLGYNTGLEVSATPTFTASFDPAFGQRTEVTAQSGSPGASTTSLAVATAPFTMEGRSYFGTGETGGIIASKAFWPSQTAFLDSGAAGPDWVLSVQPDKIRFSWGSTGGVRLREVVYPAIFNQDFAWAVTDDGTQFRVYINGVLVEAQTSVSDDAFPPSSSNAAPALFNALAGYLGNTPNWGGSGYKGKIDEFAVTLNTAKYTGATYPVASIPFSLLSGSRDFTIKYVVVSRVTFYYWLAATFSGAMLGIKPLPARSLILKKQLLLQNIPEALVDDIANDLESMGEVVEDFTAYLRSIKDPLEKALFAILLGSIFLNS